MQCRCRASLPAGHDRKAMSNHAAIYRYDTIDQALVDERVAEYRSQLERFLAGELSEDEFRPLRLRNGLYVQRHAPMYRIAVPYGLLASRQLRKLASVA